METHPVIYIVDDDDAILNQLKVIIAKIFPKSRIYTASNGLEAWEMFKTQSARFIVISDVYMPELNGFQLLKMVRNSDLLKNNYFIITTESNEGELNIKALQSGADDFLTKPIAIEQLLAKLRLISRLFVLQEQLKAKDREMQKRLEAARQKSLQAKDSLYAFQCTKFQGYNLFSGYMQEAALWIAEKMDITDASELESIRIACQLAYIGKLGLDEKSARDRIYVDGVVKNEAVLKIPVLAKSVVSSLDGLSDAAEILGSVYENFDGSGFPEKKIGWAIPSGSRILRVVLDFFETIQGDRKKSNQALQTIEESINKFYDLKVVTLMDQFTAFKDYGSLAGRERDIENHEIIEGLYVTRSVYTESGIKLIGSGVTLTQEMVDKTREILKNDSIIGKIWVRRTS